MNSREPRAMWWTVPASCILILLTVAMLLGHPERKPEKGTSYDASGDGFRAAYLLLERLGYPVVRSKRPLGASVRWILFPKPSKDDPALLKHWVREGGIIVLGDSAADFARQLGLNVHINEVDSETKPAAVSPPSPYPLPPKGEREKVADSS